jgi:hypothetical protein
VLLGAPIGVVGAPTSVAINISTYFTFVLFYFFSYFFF